MKKYIFLAAIFTSLSCLTFAQEPVLFDGTNPVVLSFQTPSGQGALPSHDAISQTALITPAELATQLQSDKKPLILNVGPRTLYLQAHIPGAEYMGAGSSDASQQKLRERVKSLPKESAIVLYCGCCPWSHCPNVHPAYQLLHSLGYTNVKVMYVTGDFGTDWADKGYPVAKGE
jgi:rhodanese-related sulfurtransferase